MTDSYVSYRTVRDLRHKNMLFLNIPWIYVIRCLFMQCSCSTNFKGIKQKIWILIVTNHSQSYVPLRCVALNSGIFFTINITNMVNIERYFDNNMSLSIISSNIWTSYHYTFTIAYTTKSIKEFVKDNLNYWLNLIKNKPLNYDHFKVDDLTRFWRIFISMHIIIFVAFTV